jgi:hypothetical protein
LFIIASLALSTLGSIGFFKYLWLLSESYNPQSWRGIIKALAFSAANQWDLTVAIAGIIGMDITLVLALGMLVLECSKNLTLSDWARRDAWRKTHPGEKFVNAYDKGLFANWKEIFWPPFVAISPPYVPSMPPVPEEPSLTETQNDGLRKRESLTGGNE